MMLHVHGMLETYRVTTCIAYRGGLLVGDTCSSSELASSPCVLIAIYKEVYVFCKGGCCDGQLLC